MRQLDKELAELIHQAIQNAQTAGDLPQFEIPAIEVTRPKRKGQGDLSYPAMQLAKLARKNPLDIATVIQTHLPDLPAFDKIEVAPPGFVNGFLSNHYLNEQVDLIIQKGESVFQLDIGQGKKAQVEFVSANPSGPITIGHTRNAVVGDTMARLLEAAGYDVQREYYYNNAGNQMTTLGKSLMQRYKQQLGQDVDFPADYYQGDYLMDIAKKLVEAHGDSLQDKSWGYFKNIAESRMFDWIKQSLAAIDIHHDAFFNETSLFESEEIWQVLETLRDNGCIYESAYREGASAAEVADVTAKGYQPATWFRSSQFGDEKDRVMVKSDGQPTYTLPDIAYHQDKLKRGFDIAINILGADHFSQAAVVRHGIRALKMNPDPIHIIFIQMVRAVRQNEETGGYETVKQSKRAGNFDTLDDLVEMTSADAVRYHMLARSPHSQLDFDVDEAVAQSNENPVYYIQNAHVRCAGILREAAARGLDDNGADLSLLGEPERGFIRQAMGILNVIEQAVTAYEPHKIAFFAHDLASAFHPMYDRVRALHSEVPPDVAKARLRFYRAARIIFQHLLRLMGMSAPERM